MSRTVEPAPLPPPPENTSLSASQLTRAAGVTVRAMRYYVAHGALAPPEFRSHKTRYDRAFLIRLRALVALRRKKLKLAEIIPRLDSASPEELLRLAGYAVPEPAPEPAPQAPVMASSIPGTPSLDGDARLLPAGFLGPYRGPAYPTERWEHIEICPGVRLLVRCEADAEAWRVAREIVATFGQRA